MLATGIASADPATKVDVSGFVQADAVAYAQDSVDQVDPSTGAPLAQEHFGIPRASLRVDGRRDDVFSELELEAFTTRATLPRPTQTTGVRLEIAQVGWRYGTLVEVSGGLFRTPFGAQTPTSPRTRPFLELPVMSRALFPGDMDAGVMVRGAYGLVRWSLAAMNGAPVGDAQWKGQDPSASYDLIGRIGADVPLPYRGRVIAGVSALDGNALHPGIAPTKDSIQWVDENQDGIVQSTELQVIPGSPGEPSATFSHDAIGADVAVHWCLCVVGKGYAFAEGVIAKNLDRGLVYADPLGKIGRDVRELGVVVGVVQDIGEHASAGVRYDRYVADRDAAEQLGVDFVQTHQLFSTWAVMAATRWGSTRVMVEYDHNNNPFGRNDAGMPTTMSSDRLTVRGQADF